jgi:hypothetical protein
MKLQWIQISQRTDADIKIIIAKHGKAYEEKYKLSEDY